MKLLEEEINAVAEGEHGNYKSVLQQLAQKDFNETPYYHLLDERSLITASASKLPRGSAATATPSRAGGARRKKPSRRLP
ncbi:MAG: hypothetical protein U0744_01825 [Gemmataceae bacterium]